MKERVFTTPSKIGDKEEWEGENDFVFSLGGRAAMPRHENLGTNERGQYS